MANKDQKRLERLVVAIEDWRRGKERISAIMPQALWDEAAALAAQFGVGDVCRRTRLDHSKLKRLAEGATDTPSLATFVELPRPSASVLSCAIEIESSDARMRATVNGATAEQVAMIFREFARSSCCK